MNKEKEIELLCAYLDGELSPEGIKDVEERLSLSPALRKNLAELERVKELTKSSSKKIEEAPYFETRLFASIEERPYKNRVKKWLPVGGVAVLTITLMLVLKFNPDFIENIFEEQKSNLAGFYKENLKPLLFAADLTNEDIFNFAFYNKLPLDNTNSQYIQLGSDPSGNEYFEINTAGLLPEEDNFEKFMETLEMDEKQKNQFDSIMSSYAEALQTQILVNDKNTVAINENLWNYQKAIAADIMAFAKTSNKKAMQDVMPVLFKVQSPVIKQVVNAVRTKKDNDYIFFTPDTLFIDTYVFDSDKFNREMELARKEIKRGLDEMGESRKEMEELNFVRLRLDSSLSNLKRAPRVDKNMNIYIDSNLCRVHIDKIEIPDIELPNMENLEELINEATEQVRAFTFTIPDFDDGKQGKKIRKYNYKIEIDDSNSTFFNMDIPGIPDVDSIIQEQMKNLNEGGTWNSPIPNDSMMKWFNFFKGDSSYSGNPMKFEIRMEEFEEEMEKFKEEMDNLKKEIKKDSVKVRTRKPVEI